MPQVTSNTSVRVCGQFLSSASDIFGTKTCIEIELCILIQKPLVVSVKVVFTLKENKDELSLCTVPPSPVLSLRGGGGCTQARFSVHYVI